jgi:glycerol uptake facilitator-like aquaporin
MLWEFIMTFTLVFVLFAVNYHKAAGDKESQLKGTAPIALGLCLIVATFAGGPFTGASLNPARSIAPAFVFGHWSALWAYLIATIGGGVAGGYVYENLFIDADEKAVAGSDYSAVGSGSMASA